MSGRIVIAVEALASRLAIRTRLAAAFYDVVVVDSPRDVAQQARGGTTDLIVLGIGFGEAGGLALCQRLKSDPETRSVAIIVVGALEAADRLAAIDAGADDFLVSPFSDASLLARTGALIRAKLMQDELAMTGEGIDDIGFAEMAAEFACHDSAHAPAGDVVLFAGNPVLARKWSRALVEGLQVRVAVAADEREFLDLVREQRPDVAVICARNAGGDSRRLIARLKTLRPANGVASLLIARSEQEGASAVGVEIGAGDYLTEPFQTEDLIARVGAQLRRKHRTDRLRNSVRAGLRMAVTDPLTGLFNRRYATTYLDHHVNRARTRAGTLAVLLIDIDRFKSINDHHGHAGGDTVLRAVAQRLSASVRASDLVARFGGEEFLVAMPDTDIALAGQIAERIRTALASTPFSLPGTALPVHVTASIGVAAQDTGSGESAEALIRRADIALYAGKDGGRNQVRYSDRTAA